MAGLLPAIAPPPASADLQYGFTEPSLLGLPAEEQDQMIVEIGTRLRAAVLRIDVFWALAEPECGEYDDAGYLAGVVHAVESARANGMQPIVSVWNVPKWASDSSFWGTFNGRPGYHGFYPIADTALDDLQRFATHLSTLLKGQVLAYECWNEPNLWAFLYPQRARGDRLFAAHAYVKYLTSFSPGIKAGDPEALVLAGATAPRGENSRYRTSPQRFARALKRANVDDLFDGYSHHPYCVGGRKDLDPALPPASPKYTVGTGNIDVLLEIFPDKPVYLTEFGYATAYNVAFGASVSEIQQAAYLKKSFALMARHAQIKLLVWFQLRDWSPTNKYTNIRGLYMGLRKLKGGTKRAWYAYARGNSITLDAPEGAQRGARVRLQGAYTCAAIGGVRGKPLVLQRKWGTKPWVTLRTVTSGDNGGYQAFVTLQRSTRYRLVFRGVVSSAAQLVRAR